MSKFKTFLICFLVVLLLGSGGYILYIKLGEKGQVTSEISGKEIKRTLSAFNSDLQARIGTTSGLSSTVSDSSKIHTVANGLSLNLLDASDAKNDLGIRKSLYSSTIDTETDDFVKMWEKTMLENFIDPIKNAVDEQDLNNDFKGKVFSTQLVWQGSGYTVTYDYTFSIETNKQENTFYISYKISDSKRPDDPPMYMRLSLKMNAERSSWTEVRIYSVAMANHTACIITNGGTGFARMILIGDDDIKDDIKVQRILDTNYKDSLYLNNLYKDKLSPEELDTLYSTHINVEAENIIKQKLKLA